MEMKKHACSRVSPLIPFLLLLLSPGILAKSCRPSNYVKGKKPPPGLCKTDSDCCVEGKSYPTYQCSPPVSNHTKATLKLNSFDPEGDIPPGCDNKFHSPNELVATLSTGWYNKGSRCAKFIELHGNGRSVRAKVIDACDSTMGCDDDHDFQPPCSNNIIGASRAVWETLGVPKSNWDEMDIYWSDV